MLKLVYRRPLRSKEDLQQRMRWSAAEARWRQPPCYDTLAPFEPEPVTAALAVGATLVRAATTAIAANVSLSANEE